MIDVMQRLSALRETLPALRLYALVDGVQFQSHYDKPLGAASGLFPLFAGTPDAALAHAGPWLVEVEQAPDQLTTQLVELEQASPAVTWLIAPQDLTGLAQLLQLKLDIGLPDGRTALLRFWDPRVLASLAKTLDAGQREEFFAHIHEWHLLHEGRRVWIGRHHAHAQ